MLLFMVAIFGSIGTVSRYSINYFFHQWFDLNYPYATMTINILGSFLVGLIYTMGTTFGVLSDEWRIALSVGLIGGFTTFSGLAIDALLMIENGKVLLCALYVGSSVFFGILSCQIGVWLCKQILLVKS